MKLIMPNYYKKFHCIASECKHSCCKAGWEIDIDEKTLNYYNSVPGILGEKLNNNIINNSDNTAKCFALDKRGVCPFLNNKNLCDIYINLGEEHLCDICTEHPRFYEWFSNRKEAGIGLCCEEAARIVLTQENKFETYETEIPFEDCDKYNQELFDYLFSARNQIIEYINNSQDINSCVQNVLWFAHTIQQNIDFNLLDNEEIFDINSDSSPDISEYLEFLLTLEPNDVNWHEYIKICIEIYNTNKNKITEFEEQYFQNKLYLKNLALYFIWRYFLKSVFDEDVYSKVYLMTFSVQTINALFFCKWLESGALLLEDCIDIVRRFSEEIEYSEENISAICGHAQNC